jgi:hypothetical protein
MIRFLAGLFIGGTLAVAAYIELSARRGVAAETRSEQIERIVTSIVHRYGDALTKLGNEDYDTEPWSFGASDDWATDPYTEGLAQ